MKSIKYILVALIMLFGWPAVAQTIPFYDSGCGGGSSFPLTENADAAGYDLTDVGKLTLDSMEPAAGDILIELDGGTGNLIIDWDHIGGSGRTEFCNQAESCPSWGHTPMVGFESTVEIDGALYADGGITSATIVNNTQATLKTDTNIWGANGAKTLGFYNTNANGYEFYINTYQDGGARLNVDMTNNRGNGVLAVVSYDYTNDSYGHTVQEVDPHFYVHSGDNPASPTSNRNEYIGLSHNRTDAVIETAAGGIQMNTGPLVSGQTLGIRSAVQNVSCDGSATNSTSSLLPDGAILLAVTTRITTALSTATGFSAGDGSDADLYGVQAAATQGSTTDNSDATAAFANPLLAAGDVTLTWSGASCTAGAVRVSAHYIDATASTSN